MPQYPDLVEVGRRFAESTGGGACGITAFYMADYFMMDIILGDHADHGPHYWNYYQGLQYDFNEYPDGKIPIDDLWKYTTEEWIKSFDRDEIRGHIVFNSRVTVEEWSSLYSWWNLMVHCNSENRKCSCPNGIT